MNKDIQKGKKSQPSNKKDEMRTSPSEWIELIANEFKSAIIGLYTIGFFVILFTMRKIFLVLYIVGGIVLTFLFAFFKEKDEIEMEEEKKEKKK